MRYVLLLLLLLLLPALAFADGMFLPRIGHVGPSVSSPRQEALLIADGQVVRVVLRTHFVPGPRELCWLIPVPDTPRDIAAVNETYFDELNGFTAPVLAFPSKPRMLGLGCAAETAHEPLHSVTLEAAGTAGVFEYVALKATHAPDLLAWLKEHGYFASADAASVIDTYLKENFRFLALRLRADLPAGKATQAVHPVTYTYRAGKQLVFPLRISQPSSAEENEILIYTLAPGRMAAANFGNGTFSGGRFSEKPGTPSGTDYEDRLRIRSRSERAFVTEFAEALSDGSGISELLLRKSVAIPDRPNGEPWFLTRLHAVLTRAQLDRDLILEPSQDHRPVQRRHQVAGTPARLPVGVLALLAGVPLLLIGRLRRWGVIAVLGSIALL